MVAAPAVPALALPLILMLQVVPRSFGPQPAESFGTIEGTVRADDGTPLGYANVLIAGTQWGAFTLDDGSFRIENVPAGDCSLAVAMFEYCESGAGVRVEPGRIARVDIVLSLAPPATWVILPIETLDAKRIDRCREEIPAGARGVAPEECAGLALAVGVFDPDHERGLHIDSPEAKFMRAVLDTIRSRHPELRLPFASTHSVSTFRRLDRGGRADEREWATVRRDLRDLVRGLAPVESTQTDAGGWEWNFTVWDLTDGGGSLMAESVAASGVGKVVLLQVHGEGLDIWGLQFLAPPDVLCDMEAVRRRILAVPGMRRLASGEPRESILRMMFGLELVSCSRSADGAFQARLRFLRKEAVRSGSLPPEVEIVGLYAGPGATPSLARIQR